jgi:hypothetical protein
MKHNHTAPRTGIGLRAFKGGAVIVGLSVDQGQPRLLCSTTLPTQNEGDPLSLAPYGSAAVMKGMPLAEIAATVAEGRRRQDQISERALRDIISQLTASGHPPVVAALLVNRAGWVTNLLEYSLAWPDHVPVAEGLAVRDALRFAIRHCDLALTELDEKSLPYLAGQTLGLSPAGIDAALKIMGTAAGKPWRKEQKLACLSAWTAITTHT